MKRIFDYFAICAFVAFAVVSCIFPSCRKDEPEVKGQEQVEKKSGEDKKEEEKKEEEKKEDERIPSGVKVDGLPAVWDFYALGYTNATKLDAQATEWAVLWKTSESHPRCYATHGNHNAYIIPIAKDGLVVKSDMTVTLNPSVQACGLVKGDWYEFIVPVRNFNGDDKISVYGATGGAKGSNAFWLMEYSADGNIWYEAPGAVQATVGTSSARAHFWNTQTTVDAKLNRTVYYGPADDSFHFYAFACPELGSIKEGKLHIRLVAQGGSGNFDGSVEEKGWTDIKSFHIYPYDERPDPLMKIISHRGGYLENGHPECSRAALIQTIKTNCMGSECDIMWTADDNVVVCHPDGNGKVNGLTPKSNTLAAIQAAGKLSNGETVPGLREYLEILTDPGINPYGTKLWLDIKWVSADLTDKVIDATMRIAVEMKACDLIAFLIPKKYTSYVTKAAELKQKYSVESAWNGQVAYPSMYGAAGWAQLPYSSYRTSKYWPPTTYVDAGMQASIYQTPSSKSYGAFYADVLPYYPVLKALFVNHPVDLAQHLVAGGYEL